MGFAVRDFYLNGGAQAVIARAFKAAGASVAELDAKGIPLVASSPGMGEHPPRPGDQDPRGNAHGCGHAAWRHPRRISSTSRFKTRNLE